MLVSNFHISKYRKKLSQSLVIIVLTTLLKKDKNPLRKVACDKCETLHKMKLFASEINNRSTSVKIAGNPVFHDTDIAPIILSTLYKTAGHCPKLSQKYFTAFYLSYKALLYMTIHRSHLIVYMKLLFKLIWVYLGRGRLGPFKSQCGSKAVVE